MSARSRCWPFVMSLVAGSWLGACGDFSVYKSKDDIARDHFAVGKSWPQAVTSLEETFGQDVSYSVVCKAEGGPDFGFMRISADQFIGPSGAPLRDLGSFRRAVVTYFGSRQCKTATVLIDNRLEVSVSVEDGSITESSVRKK